MRVPRVVLDGSGAGEARVVIDGHVLEPGQVTALRSAVTSMRHDLCSSPMRKALGDFGEKWDARLREVEDLLCTREA
jgi:hypothetical protein